MLVYVLGISVFVLWLTVVRLNSKINSVEAQNIMLRHVIRRMLIRNPDLYYNPGDKRDFI